MESLSVHAVLGLIGIIILIGLAGELFLRQTGIPSVLFLVGLGVFLGPILGLVAPVSVMTVAPYFGTLALLIILFDGGLNLHLAKVLRETPVSLLYTVVVFSLTVLATAAFDVAVLGHEWLHGLLLGSILGGTAASIVLPVIGHVTRVSEPVKLLVTLESAVVNVFVIVAALGFIKAMTDPTNEHRLLADMAYAFVIAAMLATIGGAVWARLLSWLQGQTLSYMLTLAAILVLYDLAEIIGANGAITILLFGLVLGNMETLVGHLVVPLRRAIGYQLDQAHFALDAFVKRLNEELSFLLRTFFYVLLGLLLDFATLTWITALAGIIFFGFGLSVRWLVTEAFGRTWCGWTGSERRIITAMLPRGLATAVMAFLPASTGIPNTEHFPMYAVTVIGLSVPYMTAGLVVERRRIDAGAAVVASPRSLPNE